MTMAAEARKPPSMALQVADRIRNAIILAEFDLGEALSEDSLAAAMGISRTPVREALRLLQTEGLVTVVPKSGTFVFNPAEDDIVELCEFRVMLEVRAATLALRRAGPATLKSLLAAMAEMTDAQVLGDMRLYGKADMAFHLSFLDHCGNRYLSHAYSMILGRVSALRTHLAFLTRGEPARSFSDHERIVGIFERGDDAALPEILERHILRTRENYIEALAERTRAARDTGGRSDHIRRKLGMAYPV
jgi:DNA-binding GntR family transcriptional regulator